MKPISVYNGLNMKRLAYLQNAFEIKYHQYTNALWTASFSMPYSDPKNAYCQPFNLIEIWDVDGSNQDKYIGLFRILPRVEDSVSIDGTVQYTLEHVMATLLDDTMIGWHEVGNTGTYTGQTLNYILEKQTSKKWLLETCDYNHEYLYGWQDENLLSALYSVVEPFSENDFYWDFNTQSYPWRISLKKSKKTPVTDIRYRKNLAGITKTEDPTNLTTRLYCYGYGEGDNKLTIESINNGLPYLQSEKASKYGVISQVWTDASITVEETLKAVGEAILKQLEEPKITYDIDIQTIYQAANLHVGDTVRVVNGSLDDNMIVREFSKDDVSGSPRSGKVILGFGTADLGSSIAEIADRQRISETYSQGSESIFMDSFYDNADNANPAETSFVIPENAVHVNEIRFTAKLTNFRAYSKATLGGGATTQTSTAGGSSEQTSSSGGGGSLTSASGGGGSLTSASGGGSLMVTDGGGGLVNFFSGSRTNGFIRRAGAYTDPDGGVSKYTGSASGDEVHKHSITLSDHTHMYGVPEHEHFVDIYLPNHTHAVSIPNHVHSISIQEHAHYINIPDHVHRVIIPSHTHDITIPNHTHSIEYGIYKGPIASQMSVYLDDRLIGTYASSISNLNLISYMNKNANGDIMRGEHKIKIVPSSLTRIECTFQIRLFTNARGGGQY